MACSPAIWKKFKPPEKRWWKMFYRDFLAELKTGAIPGASDLDKKARDAVAHNHACLAAWAMRDVIKRAKKDEGWKETRALCS